MFIKEQLFRCAIVIYLFRCQSIYSNHEIGPYPINVATSLIRPNSQPVGDHISGAPLYLIGLAPTKSLVM